MSKDKTMLELPDIVDRRMQEDAVIVVYDQKLL